MTYGIDKALGFLEPKDREVVINHLSPRAKGRMYCGPADVISKATVPWHATPQGWNFWRDLHNKYAPKAHRYVGLYESDPPLDEVAVDASVYRATPSWRYKGSRYGRS